MSESHGQVGNCMSTCDDCGAGWPAVKQFRRCRACGRIVCPTCYQEHELLHAEAAMWEDLKDLLPGGRRGRR